MNAAPIVLCNSEVQLVRHVPRHTFITDRDNLRDFVLYFFDFYQSEKSGF